MNRPPMGGEMGGAQPGGGLDFASSLQQLHASLPPEMQARLDPSNPITQLLFKRLRDDISEEEGQALLMLFGNADRVALSGLKKVLPEIVMLLDIFDDGEMNDSVGSVDAGAGPSPGGMSNARPTAPTTPPPGYEQDDDDDGGSAGAMSRLSMIRA